MRAISWRALFLLLMFICLSNPETLSAVCDYTTTSCCYSGATCWYACEWKTSYRGGYWFCRWLGSCYNCCALWGPSAMYITGGVLGGYWWKYDCYISFSFTVKDPKGTACDGKIYDDCRSTDLGDRCESGTYIGDDVVSVSCQQACDGAGRCNQCIPTIDFVSPCLEDCTFPMCDRIPKTAPKEECFDKIDNDCDGDIDGDDLDCIEAAPGDWVIDGKPFTLKKDFKLTNKNLWVQNGGTLTLYENVTLTMSKNKKVYLRTSSGSGGKIYLKKGAKIRYQ